MTDSNKVYATFFGDESFPVEWENEEEKKLFWWYDDLHCPKPVSPMYADVGKWWGQGCEYMYRRFGAPFGKYWPGKIINGYAYSAVISRDPEEAAKIASYYGMVMSIYADKFLGWWENRYLPEILHNYEYLDNYDMDSASLAELVVFLEEALDIHDRHWKIHWILNLSQFQASWDFGVVVNEVIGEVEPKLTGKILISVKDRNWDALEDIWKIKEKIKADPEIKAIFENQSAQQLMSSLESSASGKEIMAAINANAKKYGVKAIHTHELMNKLWVEDVTPIIEGIKGYLELDYDFPSTLQKTKDDQKEAIAELRSRVPDTATQEQRDKFEKALDLAVKMMPLTPDHHFYIDQGTNGRLRLVFLAIAKKMVEQGLLDDPEDIFFLEYEPLRWYVCNPKTADNPDGYDGKTDVKKAREKHEAALKIRPRNWVGTVTHWAMYEEPYHTLWGYPEKFNREQEAEKLVENVVEGLAAAAGIAEGPARLVMGPEDFDKVQKGEIMICVMTNPAWVVVFPKLAGVVCDAGGVLSHPSIVSREFGIPAVVGTTKATQRIKTGDQIHVDGNAGKVTILSRA